MEVMNSAQASTRMRLAGSMASDADGEEDGEDIIMEQVQLQSRCISIDLPIDLRCFRLQI